jgi:hypothetical protein
MSLLKIQPARLGASSLWHTWYGLIYIVLTALRRGYNCNVELTKVVVIPSVK